MNTLVFNAPALRYEVPAKPLNDEDKQRVCHIEDINKIQKALEVGPITPQQFNTFMDMPLDTLASYVFDQQAILNTARHVRYF